MPMMTNIVDYLAVAPLLYPEPLPMAMYATGWELQGLEVFSLKENPGKLKQLEAEISRQALVSLKPLHGGWRFLLI